MANSIFAKLLGQGDYVEAPANSEIYPGMGLERVDDSGTEKFQPVSTADANSTLIAREQRNPPRMADGNPVDEPYDATDNVEARQCMQGEEFRLRLSAGTDLATAANANVSPYDELGWSDDGTLKKGSSNPKYEALEAVDNSGAAAGEHTLILVKQLE